ncbi:MULTISPECIES: cysteine desulfurase family protein [Thermoanaerobacterium]|uniref:Class V aminotransferase n=2 Tax=Thermoanaerobacterium TaxID=28895 RepID=W9EBR2_9THEO|nr:MULTISPECIES: cysteine desulfurase family protein [Thermoanaerobacterium]AFK86561.1 aminotransferase class V [Thermoanaerobacterium saccharolyticum JW/SL-YS485]ETO38425.1 class V aminotransferase [Thermoanaerobacterium aotearoense SCUT27]
MEVYLDNSATTKVRREVVEKMVEAMEVEYGNPSSVHRKGYNAEKILSKSREDVAKLLGCESHEVFFTSGGTESNNLAIRGIVHSMKRNGNHLITTKIEHPSVLNVMKQLEEEGFDVTYLNVDNHGYVDLDELKNAINDRTILMSIMAANNEIGTIEPLDEIAKLKRMKDKFYFHVDGVQAVGKINIDLKNIDIDLLSISGHKMHGPKGIGALYVKKGTKIKPILYGGGQEANLRSGTENMPGIVGLGEACRFMKDNFIEYEGKLRALKKRLYDGIKSEIPDIHLNGPDIDDGAPQILNISFLGVRGEVLLHALEEKGIYVSTGSACSSHKNTESHVLKAIGLSHEYIEGAIRFSLSVFNTEEEIDYAIQVLKEKVNFLRRYKRR